MTDDELARHMAKEPERAVCKASRGHKTGPEHLVAAAYLKLPIYASGVPALCGETITRADFLVTAALSIHAEFGDGICLDCLWKLSDLAGLVRYEVNRRKALQDAATIRAAWGVKE